MLATTLTPLVMTSPLLTVEDIRSRPGVPTPAMHDVGMIAFFWKVGTPGGTGRFILADNSRLVAFISRTVT